MASISHPSALSVLWFCILLACLGLSLLRLRPGASPADLVARDADATGEKVAASGQGASRDDAAYAAAFLSAAGHDLRQPLQAISLYAATLATHPLPDGSKQLVGGLEAAAETLSVQFEEVMAISKLVSGRVSVDPKPVALGAILSSTVATHIDEAHDKSLHLRHVGSSLRVWADEALLAKAVDRLVAHAVRTTEHGGVLAGCRRHGDDVLLEVCDSSGGIAQEQVPEVFRPFSGYGQRLMDRGLGLAFADSIVKSLGGTLTLRVVAGRGNIYTIRLPRLLAAAA